MQPQVIIKLSTFVHFMFTFYILLAEKGQGTYKLLINISILESQWMDRLRIGSQMFEMSLIS